MAVFKCKMCGGTVEFEPGATVGTCDSCGTQQTLPRLDDDRRANLYDRANHFRRNNEFDKAMSLYEQILNEDSTDAEAYWSLVLCRYGIEYVEDPAAHKRVPTVNRAQFTSVFDDDNYKSAIQYADLSQRQLYEEEARAINEIQKGILSISQKEEPFDVFICYKETDAGGRRTPDSVLANDLYHQLTQEGFKVFFARITLEDKLGTAYEPYIFAALNSAKVMVVLGTRQEYFNAVWVKNEWSRYLALVKTSGGKKVLIPAYKDMDPYDLPEEFSHLQAQDMSKLGFMQDLIRGIKKIAAVDDPRRETVAVQQSAAEVSAIAQAERGNMALEDGEWERADAFFEKALNLNPRCAEAYIGKLLVREKKVSWKELVESWKNRDLESTGIRQKPDLESPKDYPERSEAEKYNLPGFLSFSDIRELYEQELYEFNRGYISHLASRETQKNKLLAEIAEEKLLSRARQYAQGDTQKQIEDGLAELEAVLDERIAKAREEDEASIARIKETYQEHIVLAKQKAEEMLKGAEGRRERAYESAVDAARSAEYKSDYERAISRLKGMCGYKDSEELLKKCQAELTRLAEEERQEIERKEAERQADRQGKIAELKDQLVHLTPEEKRMPEYQRLVSEVETRKEEVETAETAYRAVMESVTREKAHVQTEIEEKKKRRAGLGIFSGKEKKELQQQIDALNLKFEKLENGLAEKQTMVQKAKEKAEKADLALEWYIKISLFNRKQKHMQKLRELGVAKYELQKLDAYSTIKFGRYMQEENGLTAPVEWRILENSGNKVLLISEKAVDCQPYNTKDAIITWEQCSIRKWLNNDFLNATFSDAEKAMISAAAASADKNPDYKTNPGGTTTDKVFLLSIVEAHKYFNDDEERKCVPTAYAKANGANTSSYHTKGDAPTCNWWLRSPGYIQLNAALVNVAGGVYSYGNDVRSGSTCVRPALWIDLSE